MGGTEGERPGGGERGGLGGGGGQSRTCGGKGREGAGWDQTGIWVGFLGGSRGRWGPWGGGVTGRGRGFRGLIRGGVSGGGGARFCRGRSGCGGRKRRPGRGGVAGGWRGGMVRPCDEVWGRPTGGWAVRGGADRAGGVLSWREPHGAGTGGGGVPTGGWGVAGLGRFGWWGGGGLR